MDHPHDGSTTVVEVPKQDEPPARAAETARRQAPARPWSGRGRPRATSGQAAPWRCAGRAHPRAGRRPPPGGAAQVARSPVRGGRNVGCRARSLEPRAYPRAAGRCGGNRLRDLGAIREGSDRPSGRPSRGSPALGGHPSTDGARGSPGSTRQRRDAADSRTHSISHRRAHPERRRQPPQDSRTLGPGRAHPRAGTGPHEFDREPPDGHSILRPTAARRRARFRPTRAPARPGSSLRSHAVSDGTTRTREVSLRPKLGCGHPLARRNGTRGPV